MNTLVIATHNEGKVKEFGELLAPLGVKTLSAGVLGLPEPEETGATFAANARIKSESAAQEIAARKLPGHCALADDSGLSVEGLNGDPGVHSARWAGKEKDFKAASERIRIELERKGITATGARASFVCVLSFTDEKGETTQFEGRVDGTLRFPPRGANGFGYDPIFIPENGDKTFAEMDSAAKHAVSHRARALRIFAEWLGTQIKRQAS